LVLKYVFGNHSEATLSPHPMRREGTLRGAVGHSAWAFCQNKIFEIVIHTPRAARASLLLSPWRLRGLRIGARRGRWLAASIFLASRMASAQEALRNSLASQVTAQARRVQQESGLYTVKAGDFRLLVTPSLRIDWNDNVNVSKSN